MADGLNHTSVSHLESAALAAHLRTTSKGDSIRGRALVGFMGILNRAYHLRSADLATHWSVEFVRNRRS
jgi:hypothetical protein